MRKYHFLKNKYGPELLIDTGIIPGMKNYLLTDELHTLNFYEIIFLNKARGFFIQDGQQIPLEPQTIIFTAPGQVRQWKIKKKLEGIILTFEGDFISNFFNDPLFLFKVNFFHDYRAPNYLQLDKTNYSELISIQKKIKNEISILKTDSEHVLRAYLYLIILLLNRHYSKSWSLFYNNKSSLLFFKFRQLLEQNIYNFSTVQEYSSGLGISNTLLNKLCFKTVGQSPSDIIKDRKLAESKKLLKFSNLTAAEVAYRLNFSDPANFSRFFKRLTNQTPTEFKRKY